MGVQMLMYGDYGTDVVYTAYRHEHVRVLPVPTAVLERQEGNAFVATKCIFDPATEPS